MDLPGLVRSLAEPLAAERGLVLVDVEYHGGRRQPLLRVTLHKADGVGIEDLAGFHRALEPLLDAAGPKPGSYMLECSSPGAERPLRTERELEIFTGRAVHIAAKEAIGGRREWSGRLLGAGEGQVRIALGPDDGDVVAVPLAQLAWARLRLQ